MVSQFLSATSWAMCTDAAAAFASRISSWRFDQSSGGLPPATTKHSKSLDLKRMFVERAREGRTGGGVERVAAVLLASNLQVQCQRCATTKPQPLSKRSQRLAMEIEAHSW